MTRAEAIAIRTRQLSGEVVGQALLAQAIAFIQRPEPAPLAKHEQRPTETARHFELRMLAARKRVNNRLAKKLEAAIKVSS